MPDLTFILLELELELVPPSQVLAFAARAFFTFH